MQNGDKSEREKVYSLSVVFYGINGSSYMHFSTYVYTDRSYFTVYVIGTKAGVCSYCIYVLLGIVGLPVFSGYVGGPAKIAGPTGGYIVGFVLMALIGGFFIEKFKRNFALTLVGWVLGTFVDYCLGTVWFVYVAHCSLLYALKVCVYPFIIFDLGKIVIATLLGHAVRYALVKAGLLNNIKADAKAA